MKQRARVEKVCPICNVNFSVIPSLARVVTCSRNCRNRLLSIAYTGHRVSEETRAKMSASKLGKPSPFKGRKISETHRANITASKRGEKNPNWQGGLKQVTCRTCNKSFSTRTARYCSKSCGLRGRIVSKETKTKISIAHSGIPKHKIRGEKHPHWRGGITGWQNSIRTSLAYKEWRRAVLKRDNYMCRICGVKTRNLHVDHIKQFAFYPEERLNIDNGRTLCVSCHVKTPSYGYNGVKNKTKIN